MPTRSPSLTWPASAPTAITWPTPSWPGMNGRWGFTGQSPSAACKSVWQTPQASILTSTSWAPGRGTSTSSIASGLPNPCTTAAFIFLTIDASCGSDQPLRADIAVHSATVTEPPGHWCPEAGGFFPVARQSASWPLGHPQRRHPDTAAGALGVGRTLAGYGLERYCFSRVISVGDQSRTFVTSAPESM